MGILICQHRRTHTPIILLFGAFLSPAVEYSRRFLNRVEDDEILQHGSNRWIRMLLLANNRGDNKINSIIPPHTPTTHS